MIAEYNRKSLSVGIPGLALQLICLFGSNLYVAYAKAHNMEPSAIISLLMLAGILVGDILLIIGLCYYAKGKGYTPVLGLLGLLSCIGLLILAVLPDKTKAPK